MTKFWIDVLAIILELLIYMVFFHHFFGTAKFTKLTMAGIYSVIGIVSLIVSYFPVPDTVQTISYLGTIMLLALCYQGKIFIKLFVPFAFQLASMAVEKSYAMILGPMRLAVELYGDAGFNLYYFTGVVLSNLTILLLVKVLAAKYMHSYAKRQDMDIPLHYIVLFAVPLFMFYCIEQMALLITQTGDFSPHRIIAILVLTGFTMAFLLLFDVLLQSIERKKQLELLGKQLELEHQYHAILLDKHQQFQGLRHDMKQNMNNIANLIKNEHYTEAMQYAEQQSGQLAQTSVIETGHPLLDSILTVKEQQAHQVNAQVHTFIAAELSQLSVDIGDIASICSNAMDNAIEAVCQVESQEERKIWFTITQEQHFLHIVVRNTVAEDIKIMSNRIPTTKEDPALHGFGLQIIQRITAKYNGNCALECHDRMFSIKIILPLEN